MIWYVSAACFAGNLVVVVVVVLAVDVGVGDVDLKSPMHLYLTVLLVSKQYILLVKMYTTP